HLLNGFDLAQEVVEGELPAKHASRVFLRLLLINDFGEVLHEADDVTHAEDSPSHALWAKLFELVARFSHARKHDGRAGDVLDAQRGSPPSVSIGLGENGAC